MNEVEEIELVIEPDGKTRIEVRGVPGPGCVELTAALEARLGTLVGERLRTSAYFDPVPSKTKTQSVIRARTEK